MSSAARAALQSIARDAGRLRMGSRSDKERAADIEIVIRGASSTASPDAEAYGFADEDKELPGRIDDEDDL